MIETLRVLRVCRKTAIQALRIAMQLIQMAVVCAPENIRDPPRNMTRKQLIRKLAAARPDLTAYRQVENAYRISLKSLTQRYLELHDEIADLDEMIEHIVKDLAPELIAQTAIGVNSAAQLLLKAGENSDRFKSEASFAALCGVSPIPASSGKTVRHRLNRGGARAENSAIHIIDIGMLRLEARTQAYVARRIVAGNSKLEAIRCLKRLHRPRSPRHHYAAA